MKKRPSPPTSSVPFCSPSKKRLITDSKPPRVSVSASQDSTLSMDSSSEKLCKRTRELPNLSDCHCCGTRINHTNPKERLQTLDSIWRIVLLCKKCVKTVESGQSCPYCFKETSENEEVCNRCRDCQRLTHKDCVIRYGNSPPWSYCCSNLEFSVCIDCWIPESLANSVVFPRSKNRKIDSNLGVNSRVLINGNDAKSLGDVVKDAKLMMEKKVAVAAKAKDNALKKAVVARNAVELANNALDLMVKKDENGTKSECVMSSSSSTATTENTAVNDAELAFRLHRAMNSSPRISKNLFTIKSSWNVNLPGRRSASIGAYGNSDECYRSKLSRTVSEPSEFVRALGSDSCISLGISTPKLITYKRNKLKRKECQQNGGIGLGVGLVRNCNFGDENKIDTESQSCLKQDCSVNELHLNDTSTCCSLNYEGNSCSLQVGSCNGNADRYLLKYSKRRIGSKAALNNGTKILSEALPHEDHGSALGLPMNCSKELRTYSDASNQSCALNLHALACVSGSSREQP